MALITVNVTVTVGVEWLL